MSNGNNNSSSNNNVLEIELSEEIKQSPLHIKAIRIDKKEDVLIVENERKDKNEKGDIITYTVENKFQITGNKDGDMTALRLWAKKNFAYIDNPAFLIDQFVNYAKALYNEDKDAIEAIAEIKTKLDEEAAKTKQEIEEAEQNDPGYLRELVYYPKDKENSGKRTIRINNNSKLAIILSKENKYYSTQTLEDFVHAFCISKRIDSIDKSTVQELVKAIIYQVNNNNNNSKNNDDDDNEEEEEDKNKSSAKAKKALVVAIRHSRELFQDEFGRAFAAMRVDDHVEVHPMDEQRFKNWISGLYYKEEDDLLSEEDLKKIVRILTSRAEFDSTIPKHKLDLRVRGYNNNNTNNTNDNDNDNAVGNVGNVGVNGKEIAENFDIIYYDLTNLKWEMIKITPEGWDIDRSDNPPILFRRYGSEKPQPYPDRNYEPDILDRSLDLINLKQEYKEMQKQLLKPYVISLFYPNILPKPVIILVAPQGAAKTTTFDLIKDTADPSATLTSSIPKEDHNLIQYMEHNYISFFDNVSEISNEKSDIICRAVTGSSNTKRKLYENDEDIIYNGRRIVGLNGITNAATRPDLLERGLAIELDEIAKKDRKLLRVIWRKYLELKPKLLAFCLDVISEVMKERKKWEAIDDDFFGMEELITQHGGLPRMADWAMLGEQISTIVARKEGKPYTPGTFLEAFDKNLEILNSEALKSSLVAEALIAFMTFREATKRGIDIARYGDGFSHWEGSPTVLLSELNRFIEAQPDVGINTKSRAWVTDPARLGGEIARITPNLRALGIVIDSKRTEKNVQYKITKVPTLPTLPTGGDKSRSNEGQNPVGSHVDVPTGTPTAKGGSKSCSK